MRRMLALLILVCPLAALAESYLYDAAGRVSKVTYDDGSSIEYVYDAAGNILEQRAVGVAKLEEPTPEPKPSSCGCSSGAGALALTGALAGFTALPPRRRRRARA